MVVGSQVPNLLQPHAAATLVVSRDVDLAVPLAVRHQVVARLGTLSHHSRSAQEPSVWVSQEEELLEVNFVGLDPAIRTAGETYVAADPQLPLLVFGPLSLLRSGGLVEVEDVRVPVPHPAGLLAEKLLTDRSGVKGERDKLVALALLLIMDERSVEEFIDLYSSLDGQARHEIRGNLAELSLLPALPGMPDPQPHRASLARLLLLLEATEKPRHER